MHSSLLPVYSRELLLASTLESSLKGNSLDRLFICNSCKLILNNLFLDLSLANSLIKLQLSLLLSLEDFFGVGNPLRYLNLDLGSIDVE